MMGGMRRGGHTVLGLEGKGEVVLGLLAIKEPI